MPTFRLSSKGGLYNPQPIRTINCMLANTYGGAGSYKRIYQFISNHPVKPPKSEFAKIIEFIGAVTFPIV